LGWEDTARLVESFMQENIEVLFQQNREQLLQINEHQVIREYSLISKGAAPDQRTSGD
jgi:hypothetical protein